MDIKVKDIAPANQTTPVKAQEKSDDSFKFTLISNCLLYTSPSPRD